MLLAVDALGTIIKTLSGEKLIKDPYDQTPIKGTVELLNHLKELDHNIFIVTNQSKKIDRGDKTLEQALLEQKVTLELFPMVTACCMTGELESEWFWYVTRVGREKVCGKPGIKAEKPNPGMLLYLEKRFLKQPETSWFPYFPWLIGKNNWDERAAKSAGWNFLHIQEALKMGGIPK